MIPRFSVPFPGLGRVETVRQKLDEGTEVSQAGPYGSKLTIKGFFLPSEK